MGWGTSFIPFSNVRNLFLLDVKSTSRHHDTGSSDAHFACMCVCLNSVSCVVVSKVWKGYNLFTKGIITSVMSVGNVYFFSRKKLFPLSFHLL